MDANEKIEGFAGLLWTVITKGGFRAFVFLLTVLLIFFYIESHTKLIYYYSLERRISLAKQIGEISTNNPEIESKLRLIQNELVNDLMNRKVSLMEIPTITTYALLKFLTGAGFGIIFLVIGFIYRRPKAMQGALLIASTFGLISLFVPPIGSLWVNFVIFVIVQLILLLLTPSKYPPTTPRAA